MAARPSYIHDNIPYAWNQGLCIRTDLWTQSLTTSVCLCACHFSCKVRELQRSLWSWIEPADNTICIEDESWHLKSTARCDPHWIYYMKFNPWIADLVSKSDQPWSSVCLLISLNLMMLGHHQAQYRLQNKTSLLILQIFYGFILLQIFSVIQMPDHEIPQNITGFWVWWVFI